ncbi:protein ACCELERATED CELL DEATH 6 [Eucalyptus grandis]|uniref:protein ACCELERATED CELL DEATH 6 n=1 Tax=Eucalyptus grandis TaxID=71139 RepID=UPI00192E8D26|nr:protein ACCELERATED CELL DEATH 6 [Eucalyptus grandis]
MAVEISLQEGALWGHRLQRLEAMLTQDPVSCDGTTTKDLFTAAERGQVDEFIRVVERYCSEGDRRLCLWVIRSPSRNSLLHIAADLERDEMLRAIVQHFPVNLLAEENCRGDTALHLAARAGRAPAARVLIGRASDVGERERRRNLVQVRNRRGNTPLHEAVMNDHLEVVEILIGEDLQPVYWKNKEGKCPMTLAVERGNLERGKLGVLGILLAKPLEPSCIQGESPVHAAVLNRKLDMLREISEKNPKLFGLKDDGQGTPLHLAAYINYCDGIKFLLEEFTSSAVEYDRDGYFPIHVACKEGHVQAIKELLRHWPNPMELINQHGQNILHVCAKYGSIQAVKYILGNADLEKLINERDNDGNTPLHLATLPWHPVVLLDLVLHKRVDCKLLNNECLTALDYAREQMKITNSTIRKKLPVMILKCVEAPTSIDLAIHKSRNRDIMADYIVRALQTGGVLRVQRDAHPIVATLVATVTFAAGLTVPGGFIESSEANPGTATMLNKGMFQAFVICNTIAMYTAMSVVMFLSWAQVNDSYIALTAHIMAMKGMLVALGTMSVAFMAGGYLLVSKLTWLASLVLLIGAGALCLLCGLHMATYAFFLANTRSVRYILLCGIRLGVMTSRLVARFPDFPQDEDLQPARKNGTRTTGTSNGNPPAT